MGLPHASSAHQEGGIASAEEAAAYAAISPEDAYRALDQHPHWIVERGRIYRDLRFSSFRAAIRFVDRVAEIGERQGHHPNILVHEWCFVRLDLYSHLGGHLTIKDIDLAITIDDGTRDLREHADG